MTTDLATTHAEIVALIAAFARFERRETLRFAFSNLRADFFRPWRSTRLAVSQLKGLTAGNLIGDELLARRLRYFSTRPALDPAEQAFVPVFLSPRPTVELARCIRARFPEADYGKLVELHDLLEFRSAMLDNKKWIIPSVVALLAFLFKAEVKLLKDFGLSIPYEHISQDVHFYISLYLGVYVIVFLVMAALWAIAKGKHKVIRTVLSICKLLDPVRKSEG